MNVKTVNENRSRNMAALAIAGDFFSFGCLTFTVICAIIEPSLITTTCASFVAGAVYAGREYNHAQLRSHININTETVNVNPPDEEIVE